MLYRVQDASGRGPWRPGFSRLWVDGGRKLEMPPIFLERIDFRSVVSAAHEVGLHVGCAVEDYLFGDWFTQSEVSKLKEHRFRVVNATPCKVLLRTETQVLIGSKSPLKKLSRVSWGDVA